MGDTFGQIVGSIRLRVPQAPVFLVEDWVRESFRRAWEYRKPAWSMARKEAAFVTNPQKTGTFKTTQDNAFVQIPIGSAIQLAETDEGRQFRAGVNQPVYSIECVDVEGREIELDREYTGSTQAAVQGVILDAYITFPEDFGRFLAVLDPENFFKIHYWITDDELNAWDPQRSSTGTPWALVSRRYATVKKFRRANQTVGRKQYELWPYSTSRHQYWYYYVMRAPAFSEDMELPGLLSDRSDLIRQGALAIAAEWPGTEDRKNPYFNMALAKRLHDDYIMELARLEVTDEDIYPTWWQQFSTVEQRIGPFDGRYLQSHDAL